jgi:hypothetical protein
MQEAKSSPRNLPGRRSPLLFWPGMCFLQSCTRQAMRLCSRCSKLLPLEAGYCSRCGYSLQPVRPTPIRQPHCRSAASFFVVLAAMSACGALIHSMRRDWRPARWRQPDRCTPPWQAPTPAPPLQPDHRSVRYRMSPDPLLRPSTPARPYSPQQRSPLIDDDADDADRNTAGSAPARSASPGGR